MVKARAAWVGEGAQEIVSLACSKGIARPPPAIFLQRKATFDQMRAAMQEITRFPDSIGFLLDLADINLAEGECCIAAFHIQPSSIPSGPSWHGETCFNTKTCDLLLS